MGPTSAIWCTAGTRGMRRAGHVGDAVGPHPAGDHHVLGLDGAGIGDDRLHGAVAGVGARLGENVEHLGAGQHPAAVVGGQSAHHGAGLEGVHHRHGRAVEGPKDDVGVDEGHQLAHLGGGEQAGLHAPSGRRGHAPLQLVHALPRASHLDAAGVHRQVEIPKLVGALHAEQAHLLVMVDREDEVGGVAGRASRVGKRALVHQHQIRPSKLGQVSDETVADYAGSDHHALRARRKVAHVQSSLMESQVLQDLRPAAPGGGRPRTGTAVCSVMRNRSEIRNDKLPSEVVRRQPLRLAHAERDRHIP